MPSEGGPLIAIVGPTAAGKSGFAMWLGEQVGGEVVSADSRQVYRGLDIGTDKPAADDRRLVPHHMIDVADPDHVYSLAQYLGEARRVIRDIQASGRLPLLTGGTGLYVRALLEGFEVPRVAPDPALRRELEREAERGGPSVLARRLQAVDPESAHSVDPRNVRRLVRALEVQEATGGPISAARGQHPPPYDVLQIGLTLDRAVLYQRIDARVDRMMERGLLAEVEGLAARRLDWGLPALSGIGYKQLASYLRGEVDLDAATVAIKSATHRLARQQYSWFRLDDPAIRWFDASRDSFREEALRFVGRFLATLAA
ncbi:MAG: tRNA (adenosine(37)-N6)-dimethylallyltransferase MiaA [Anaerolineae bacterium]